MGGIFRQSTLVARQQVIHAQPAKCSMYVAALVMVLTLTAAAGDSTDKSSMQFLAVNHSVNRAFTSAVLAPDIGYTWSNCLSVGC